ncbi:hypothetical protein Slin_3579 [Spirosoma linguale DSM 74]|uniref:Uncharacterized protein n=1 Tax=Spirosoma linguale (strain ATCC 33905 / DSM 74 / LMG 10896 / Claus 1) TaxID=504472 RepID=D2QR32_SPILD|nr:hypothetical protein Slin_3579 [Spirosoma linguale DSM 74]
MELLLLHKNGYLFFFKYQINYNKFNFMSSSTSILILLNAFILTTYLLISQTSRVIDVCLLDSPNIID